MKKIKLLILVFLTCVSFQANAQITAASALIVLDELKGTINETMDSIAIIADDAVGNSGNMILSAISALSDEINNTINNGDIVLRSNQQLLFNNLNSAVNDFSNIAEGALVNIDGIAARVATSVDDFFGKSKEPRVITYKTPVYIIGDDKPYEINVTGKNFDRSFDSYLNIKGERKAIDQKTLSNIKVIIPNEKMKSIVTDDKVRFVHLNFKFKYKEGFIFKKKKEKVFDFVIPCVPKKIGSAIAYYEQITPKIKYHPYKTHKASKTTGGTSGSGSRRTGRTSFNILPVDGRKIDPSSFKVISWRKRYGGGYTIQSVTEQLIKGKMYCKSQSRPFGGGGSASLTMQYREYSTEKPLIKNETTAIEIESDKLSIIKLPDPIEGNRPYLDYIKVNTFDGKEHIITVNNPSKYFSVSQNELTDNLEIKYNF